MKNPIWLKFFLPIVLGILCVSVYALAGKIKLPDISPEQFEEHIVESEQPSQNRQWKRKPEANLETESPLKNIIFDEPLTMEDCIRIGLENNLDSYSLKFNQYIQDKEKLMQKLRKLKDSEKTDLPVTWNILGESIAYVYSSKSQRSNMDKLRKRHSQKLALDIYEAYWQAAAVEDALDYVHTVKNKLKHIKENIDSAVSSGEVDRSDSNVLELRLNELELTIRKLQVTLLTSHRKLSRLMGVNQNVQLIFARPPVKPLVAALPHHKSLDIDKLEEYALIHRSDLFKSDFNVLIQRQEARMAFTHLFPGDNVYDVTHYNYNIISLSNRWNSMGIEIGMSMLNISSIIPTLREINKKALDINNAKSLMLRVGAITQIHIALLDYAIKVDKFKLLEDVYVLNADLVRMASVKNEVGRLPELAVAQRHLETMAAKLRRDEAVVELLVAHKHLCASIGINPLDYDESLVAKGKTQSTSSDSGHIGIGDSVNNRWKCPNCGYIQTGFKPPEECPICGTPDNKFKEYLGDDLTDWGKAQPISSDSEDDGTTSKSSQWKLCVGSSSKPGGAESRLSQLKKLTHLDPKNAVIEKRELPRLGVVYRIYFKGLTESDAKKMADELKSKGMEYWIIPPDSQY